MRLSADQTVDISGMCRSVADSVHRDLTPVEAGLVETRVRGQVEFEAGPSAYIFSFHCTVRVNRRPVSVFVYSHRIDTQLMDTGSRDFADHLLSLLEERVKNEILRFVREDRAILSHIANATHANPRLPLPREATAHGASQTTTSAHTSKYEEDSHHPPDRPKRKLRVR
jgi:hypothetical protein